MTKDLDKTNVLISLIIKYSIPLVFSGKFKIVLKHSVEFFFLFWWKKTNNNWRFRRNIEEFKLK